MSEVKVNKISPRSGTGVTLGDSGDTFTIPSGGANTEVSNSGSYTAGGGVLVNSGTSISAGVARTTFANLSFTSATITARGALIYNTNQSNAAVCILDFGSDKTATSGTFTIQFPANTSTASILRISG